MARKNLRLNFIFKANQLVYVCQRLILKHKTSVIDHHYCIRDIMATQTVHFVSKQTKSVKIAVTRVKKRAVMNL